MSPVGAIASMPAASERMPALRDIAAAREIAATIRAQVDGGALDAALALARAELPATDGIARATVQHAYATALASAGRPIDALRAAAAARDGFRMAGLRAGELDALLAIGSVMRVAGDFASAMETLEEAESFARDLDDDGRLAVVLRQFGICCSLLGRHQQALASLREADELHAARPFDREHLSTRLSLYNANNRSARSLPVEDSARHRELEAHLALWMRLAEDAAALGQTRTELMALATTRSRCRTAGDIAKRWSRCPRCCRAIDDTAWCRTRRSAGSRWVAPTRRSKNSRRRGRTSPKRSSVSIEAARAPTCARRSKGWRTSRRRWAIIAKRWRLRRVRAIEARTDKEAAHRTASQRELRIELARLSSQWHRLATTDPLTGPANRRALDQWLREGKERFDQGESLVVLLHDMDHFKSINDGFGHGVGDVVLRQVAALLQANCRSCDLAVRYGGEEFLLALAGVDHDRAIDIAGRLRSSIEHFDWQSIVATLRVTVSIGIAAADEVVDHAALLTLADRRLYAAKHAGRNRVIHDG